MLSDPRQPVCTTSDGRHWCDQTDIAIEVHRRKTDQDIADIRSRLDELEGIEGRLTESITGAVEKTADLAATYVQQRYKIGFATWMLLRVKDLFILLFVAVLWLLWINHDQIGEMAGLPDVGVTQSGVKNGP